MFHPSCWFLTWGTQSVRNLRAKKCNPYRGVTLYCRALVSMQRRASCSVFLSFWPSSIPSLHGPSPSVLPLPPDYGYA